MPDEHPALSAFVVDDYRSALAKDPSLKESLAAMQRLKVKP